MQGAAVEGEASVGCAEIAVAGHRERAGIEKGAAAVTVEAREREGARTGLGQAAGAADRTRPCRVVAVGVNSAAAGIERDVAIAGEAREELQRAAVEGEGAIRRAEIGIAGHRERTGIEERAATVAVEAREREGARTGLCQAAGAADRARPCRVVAVGVNSAAAGIERDVAIAGEAREELQRAAVEGEGAIRRAEVGIAGHRERAGIEERTAAVAVEAGKCQRARTGLGQAAGATDRAGPSRVVAIGVDSATAGIERDAAVAGEARQVLQRAAVEGEAAVRRAEVAVV